MDRQAVLRMGALTLLLSPGCGVDEGPWEDGPPGAAAAYRSNTEGAAYGKVHAKIVNGTRDPEAIPMAAGQVLALGWLHSRGWPAGNFCTGTLVTPRVVATASHCTEGTPAREIGFGVGLHPEQPLASFDVVEKHEHPSEDATLLVLAEDATARVPELVPIPVNTRPLDDGWVGVEVQAGGYGMTRDPSRSGRYFATVRIIQVQRSFIVVSGGGVQGICFGDSGGPAFGRRADGTPALLAVVHGGDESCVGEDWLTRLDGLTGWIEGVTGPLPDGGAAPGALPGGGADADCEQLADRGTCEGPVAVWCEPGDDAPRRLDCAATGQACAWVDDEVGFFCAGRTYQPEGNGGGGGGGGGGVGRPQQGDACGDVDFLGYCDGDTVVWCDRRTGRIGVLDCAAMGQQCGWIDDEYGHYCGEAVAPRAR